MHLLDPKILGFTILFLLVIVVIAKRISTGSILDPPKGSLVVQLVNVFNLFFLLVVNPLSAILLLTDRIPLSNLAEMPVNEQRIFIVLEIAGWVLLVAGYLLMAWALTTLGHNYQLGGSAPRSEDRMVVNGPYSLIRHPMYSAALSISLGLACLIQSWVLFGVFCIYLVLLTPLISTEENELRKAYPEQYGTYQHKTRRLIPFIF